MSRTPHNSAYRSEWLWRAAMIHRVSGVLLALFLPFHFLVLGLALNNEAKLDGFLKWTANPLVKFAEAGLVFLLAVHLLGGLRILVIENAGWRPEQKRMATIAATTAIATAAIFLVTAM